MLEIPEAQTIARQLKETVMGSVAKRFLTQGLSVEETAERTMFPIEFVKSLMH